MILSDNLEMEQKGKQSQETNSLNLLVLLPLIVKNWYWFIIALVITLYGARWYIGHTMVIYRTSATILVNDREDAPLIDNSELLMGLGLPGGMKNLQNQIMVLRSSPAVLF